MKNTDSSTFGHVPSRVTLSVAVPMYRTLYASIHRTARFHGYPAILALVVLLSTIPAFGEIFTVTNTSDSGAGSLRAAIASASNGDAINFNLPAYPATITVLSPLTFGPSVTIAGPGASSLAIDGGNAVVDLVVNAGATVAISGLTIQHGSSLLGGGIFNGGTLTLTNVTVSNNTQGTQLGGGIFNSGTLTLTSSTVSANSAGSAGVSVAGAPVTGETGFGGGIYNYGEKGGGKLTLTNSTVSGNSANQGLTGYASGGGIYNDQGQVTLTNSTVTNNTAVGDLSGMGGGIYGNSGTMTVTNSTISGNSAAGEGAGIYSSGTTTVTASTISGNLSNPTGGGSIGGGAGGGIYNAGGTLTVTNSTFAGNSATNEGGGIESEGPPGAISAGTATVSFSTFWGNSAGLGAGISDFGLLTVKNSILANNGGQNCAPIPSMQNATSDGHNLSDDGTCSFFFSGPGDLDSTPAGLDPGGLKNNGGPTQTVALLSTSQAINAIPLSPTNYCTDASGNPVKTDQRGVPRPQGSGCDIGSFEWFSSDNVVVSTQVFTILDEVEAMPISPLAKDALILELQIAVDAINSGNYTLAIDNLTLFLSSVDGLYRAGILNLQQALQLTPPAQQVIPFLPGPPQEHEQLTIQVSPVGVGITSPPAPGVYFEPLFTIVPLTASSTNLCYSFSGWTGNVGNQQSASTSIEMLELQPQNVTANFVYNQDCVQPIKLGLFVTGTQVDWGGGGSLSSILSANYNQLYASTNDLFLVGVIGSPTEYYMGFSNSAVIETYLPASGNAGPLTASPTNPSTTSAGIFGGDVVALKLNIDFSNAGLLGGTTTFPFGNLVLTNMGVNPPGTSGDLSSLNGMTVSQFLAIANTCLGAGPCPLGLDNIDALTEDLNASYENGIASTFAQTNLAWPTGYTPPSANPTATPSAGVVPLSVQFAANATDAAKNPLTYLWNFGDGNSSTAVNPSHAYGTPGVYTAQLTVSDGIASYKFALPVTAYPVIPKADTFSYGEFVTYGQNSYALPPAPVLPGPVPLPGPALQLISLDYNAAFASTNGVLLVGVTGVSNEYSIAFTGNATEVNSQGYLTNLAGILFYLPSSGPAAALPTSYIDPTNPYNVYYSCYPNCSLGTWPGGVFSGDVVALALNIAFNNAGFLHGTSTIPFGNLVLTNMGVNPPSTSGNLTALNGMTVSQFLTIANTCLGAGPCPLGIDNVDVITQDLNLAFDGGTLAIPGDPDTFAETYLALPK